MEDENIKESVMKIRKKKKLRKWRMRSIIWDYCTQNEYISSDGRRIVTSRFYTHPDGRFLVLHASNPSSQIILEDVLQRLTRLQKNFKRMSSRERAREFTSCVFGYYSAVPFARGSASIGRSFFAGYYLAVFGTKIPPIPVYLDVIAIFLKEDGFLESWLDIFEKVK